MSHAENILALLHKEEIRRQVRREFHERYGPTLERSARLLLEIEANRERLATARGRS